MLPMHAVNLAFCINLTMSHCFFFVKYFVLFFAGGGMILKAINCFFFFFCSDGNRFDVILLPKDVFC